MPEWLLPVLATAGLSALTQIGIGMKFLGTMTTLISHHAESIKDLQRNKLDTTLHEAHCEGFDKDIDHLKDRISTNHQTLDHKINGVSQRVSGLETLSRPNGGAR